MVETISARWERSRREKSWTVRQGLGIGIGLGTDPDTRPPLRFKYVARSINQLSCQST